MEAKSLTIISDYNELHTGDVINFNDMKLVVVGLSNNSYYNVECLGATREDKISLLDGICNVGIRWETHTSVELLGHVSFADLIDTALNKGE